jgi:hypothetical protein
VDDRERLGDEGRRPLHDQRRHRPRPLFGLSHRNSGQFFALDAKTGKTIWTSPPRQASNAAILFAGDVLFMLKDDGELLIGDAAATLSRRRSATP